MNSTKNKIKNNIFIQFDESKKSKRTVSINERVIQYVFQIAAAALIIDKNSYEKNFENIFKFIRNLQIYDASTTQCRSEI